MNCEQCQTLLLNYLEGTINQSNRNEADNHLLNCTTCGNILDHMKQLKIHLQRQVHPQALPQSLWRRVLNQPLLKLTLAAILFVTVHSLD